MLRRLYVRIWLAVVLAVAVLTLLVGWAWRLASEPPLREVVVRDNMGVVIGKGELHHMHEQEGEHTNAPPNDAPINAPTNTPPTGIQHGQYGNGPEFTVHMADGNTLHLHMPRAAGNWRAPFGFFWTLGLVAVAVALAIYPIVRRLTRRLETLQRTVERWGNGELGARATIAGDDEVGVLARGFNHAAEQIEALIKARDALLHSQKSLLANASHELRSPLTRIRMGLEFLSDAADSPARLEISRSVVELDQLVDEILLASRLDAKDVDLGTVEAVDLVGMAAEECGRCAAKLDVAVSVLPVPGVAKLLRRIVRNLLENARRYAAGDVSLALFTQDNWCVIQVNDRGPGVPEALQERIFEPFYRLPGASERDGGVGLGLALVKSIATRHGGTVQCRNRDDGGATFEVRLPCEP